MRQEITAVDLFAGGGGTSTGLALAARSLGRKVDLTAINHWRTAIETHERNHPWARHICANVEDVNPRKVVPGGRVDILVASPECLGHSRAAGGRPKNDQSRASGWAILRWLESLDVSSLLVENVEEYRMWGPLDKRGHPVKSRKGETYQAWLNVIRSLGYTVDERTLNAADYGAPTSRRRLFVMAKKGEAKIRWPRPTHSQTGMGRRRWRAARRIIDWSIEGKSIFVRRRPLSANTIRRIIEGLRRFGGEGVEPFIVLMEQSGRNGPMVKSIGDPLPTITTAKGGSMGLVEPFVLSQASGGAPRPVGKPLPTIPAKGAHSLIQPFIVPFYGENGKQKPRTHSVSEPLPAVAASNTHALVRPFLLPVRGFFGGNTPKSVDEPLGTITQRGYGGVVEPCLIQYNGASNPQSVEDPLGTVTTKDRFGLVEPYIIRFNGTDGDHIKNSARSIKEPLPTVTASTHYALVQPVINNLVLDIRFRMLQPHELALAMGFPRTYKWGRNTKRDIVKMIGNAVQVDVARALCRALLSS